MGKFKSGVILKNSVVLTPIYNESHSVLLRKNGIADTYLNSRKVFIKVELIPLEGDILSDVNTWKYSIDQYMLPDWYKDCAENYEKMFRSAVKKWRDENIFNICGVPCTKLKEENGNTYYHVCTSLFDTEFGNNNDYRSSYLRERLLRSDFARSLQKEFGDDLVPTSINLTAIDGLKNYGNLDGDLLAIPDINLYRECRENIFYGNEKWWLSTPESLYPGYASYYGDVVRKDGLINWENSERYSGVRPFFILKNEKKSD